MVGVREFRDLLPSDLSTGMKRSVAIARALAAQPEAVLYDEPTTMVDPLMAHLLGDLIKKLKRQLKLTSIVVTHDMALAKKLADRLLFLHEAKAIFFGTFAEMQKSNEPIVQEFLELDSLDFERYFGERNVRRTTALTIDIRTLEPLCDQSVHGERAGLLVAPRPFLQILGNDVGFDVHRVAGLQRIQVRHLDGVRDDGDRQAQSFEIGDGQADAFDRDRSLEDHVLLQVFWNVDVHPEIVGVVNRLKADEAAGAIDVPLDDVTAHAGVYLERQFEIDLCALGDA